MKILILADIKRYDNILQIILDIIAELFITQKVDIEIFWLKDIKILPCAGSFNCWLRTPGICMIKNDEGSNILKNLIQSDAFIIISPIVCGGYSSEMKKIIDRLAPLANPFFTKRNNKTQHIARYNKLFRFAVFGLMENGKEIDAGQIFKNLVDRNAVNFIRSVHSTEIIVSNETKNIVEEKVRRTLAEIMV
jgi:multimeric flavodoxin WrbA